MASYHISSDKTGFFLLNETEFRSLTIIVPEMNKTLEKKFAILPNPPLWHRRKTSRLSEKVLRKDSRKSKREKNLN